jgi:hypothetical protein
MQHVNTLPNLRCEKSHKRSIDQDPWYATTCNSSIDDRVHQSENWDPPVAPPRPSSPFERYTSPLLISLSTFVSTDSLPGQAARAVFRCMYEIVGPRRRMRKGVMHEVGKGNMWAGTRLEPNTMDYSNRNNNKTTSPRCSRSPIRPEPAYI